MLKAKLSKKNLSQKIAMLRYFRRWKSEGVKKKRFLLHNAHPCMNPHRLSHFAWRSVGSSHQGKHRQTDASDLIICPMLWDR